MPMVRVLLNSTCTSGKVVVGEGEDATGEW